jgi:hypothetical protein
VKPKAVIEQAVEEWTNTILGLPDAQALANRRRERGDKGPGRSA